MSQTFDIGHLGAHLRSFAVFLHLLGGEINHEEREGHGEFRVALSLCRTLALWRARAASPQCSAACRAQIPVGKLPTVAGWQPALPRSRKDARGLCFLANARGVIVSHA